MNHIMPNGIPDRVPGLLATLADGGEFVTPEKEEQYFELLKQVLPKVGTDERKIITAEVLLALKLEGIIGEDLSANDVKLIKTIKEAIFLTPQRKEEALRMAKVLLA